MLQQQSNPVIVFHILLSPQVQVMHQDEMFALIEKVISPWKVAVRLLGFDDHSE